MGLFKRNPGASNPPPAPGKVAHEGQGGKAHKTREIPKTKGKTGASDNTVSRPKGGPDEIQVPKKKK